MSKSIKAAVVAVGLMGAVGVASAAGYCSASAAPGLSVNDVKFEAVASNDCYGVVDLANQNTDTITNFANNTGLWTPNSWSFLARDSSTDTSNSLGGYTFALAATSFGNGNPTPIEWTLTVTGTPTPFTMDFLVYLHAGSNSAYYYFNDREINTSNTGTFQIKFTAGNGNSNSFPGLSGISLLGRDIRNDGGCQVNCNPSIPEPASLALAGLALAGLGLARRRRNEAPRG